MSSTSAPNLKMQRKQLAVRESFFSGENGLFTLVSSVLTGLYTALAFIFPASERTVYMLVTLLLLAAASFADIREYRIPATILCGMFITGIIHSVCFTDNYIVWIAAAAFSVVLLVVRLIKKEAVGSGDILLLGLGISSLVPERIFSFLFLSFFLTSVYGIIRFALNRNIKGGVPMAPCVMLAWLTVLVL